MSTTPQGVPRRISLTYLDPQTRELCILPPLRRSHSGNRRRHTHKVRQRSRLQRHPLLPRRPAPHARLFLPVLPRHLRHHLRHDGRLPHPRRHHQDRLAGHDACWRDDPRASNLHGLRGDGPQDAPLVRLDPLDQPRLLRLRDAHRQRVPRPPLRLPRPGHRALLRPADRRQQRLDVLGGWLRAGREEHQRRRLHGGQLRVPLLTHLAQPGHPLRVPRLLHDRLHGRHGAQLGERERGRGAGLPPGHGPRADDAERGRQGGRREELAFGREEGRPGGRCSQVAAADGHLHLAGRRLRCPRQGR